MEQEDPSNDLLTELEAAYAKATGAAPPASADLNKLTEKVIGAAIEVHRHLGPGFHEAAYEEALVIELRLRGISVERQVPLSLSYKQEVVWTGKLDLLVEERLVVELKAIETILPLHRAQLHSYLCVAKQPLGLLLNFNVTTLREGIHRVIRKT